MGKCSKYVYLFWLSGGQLGWAELSVGGWLCRCSCQGVVGRGAEQRRWDRDKAVVWDTGRESLCLYLSLWGMLRVGLSGVGLSWQSFFLYSQHPPSLQGGLTWLTEHRAHCSPVLVLLHFLWGQIPRLGCLSWAAAQSCLDSQTSWPGSALWIQQSPAPAGPDSPLAGWWSWRVWEGQRWTRWLGSSVGLSSSSLSEGTLILLVFASAFNKENASSKDSRLASFPWTMNFPLV